ncbi:Hypothetical protein PHPALM_9162 [Phytophthora palmivora]|uniref:Serine protease family S33 n=1 Tax=Phytophthora palmivora TaxID=4796 RepID=A0A2P4Y7Z7_9STRA|nr:Hypothetical protein PHPALM_9162 [Phytophthora palmivora]
MRTLIPPLVYRLNRCGPKDIDVLKKFVTTLSSSVLGGESQDEAYVSNVLFYLIVFSEMWEIPTPSKAEMKERYTNAKVSDDPNYTMDPVYCAFSKEKSASCKEFGLSNYDANPIMYERDQYWNKSATIPSHASVLLLSGKLDPQTHHKYAQALLLALDGTNKELISFDYAPHGITSSTQMVAGDPSSETCGSKILASVLLLSGKLDPQTHHKYAEALLMALDGTNKELISFDYAPHGITSSTQMVAGDPSSETCGSKILASYVRNRGDLKKMDKSCVAQMPGFNLTVPPGHLHGLMGTDDAYDGVYKLKSPPQ